jgi:hypothetical protein
MDTNHHDRAAARHLCDYGYSVECDLALEVLLDGLPRGDARSAHLGGRTVPATAATPGVQHG